MRVKFTIAVCALLMLGLVVTQVNAQGFNVSKSETTVVEHGRNQMMGAIRLDYVATGGNIDDGRTIKVNYGSLRITSTGDPWSTNTTLPGGATLACGTERDAAPGNCDDTAATATVANDADTGVGTVTITLGTDARTAGAFVILRGVRADVSGSVCRRHDRGLHQFLGGRDRFRSHLSGQDRKRGRHGVHRQGRPDRETRASQPAPVQPRYSPRSLEPLSPPRRSPVNHGDGGLRQSL